MHTPECSIRIVDYDNTRHLAALRAGSIALQDFERALDSRLPDGSEIVDVFVPQMLHRCRACDGAILVAECSSEIAGFVTVLTRVSSDEIQDGNYEYGLISDLFVVAEFRGRGVGKRLLHAAEQFARDKNVATLRVAVMAENVGASQLYSSNGYKSLFTELEKDL